MFIKQNEILNDINDSQVGKKVVSVNVAQEMKNKINLLLSNNETLITALDKYALKYIKEKLGITSSFPVNSPKINDLYLYNNKVYKLIGNSNIKKIITGCEGCFVLTNYGKVYFSGANNYGEGGFDATGIKTIHTEVIFSDDVLPIEDKIIDIAHSDYSTHFLTDKGNIIVCGQNNRGSLGIGNTTNQTVKIKSSFSFPSKVKKIVVGGCNGYQSTFYMLEDGKVYSCGCNAYGQLGTKAKGDKTTPTEITSNIPGKILDISIGNQTTDAGTTMFLTDDNRLFICGYNGHGQLGNNSTTSTEEFIPISIPGGKKVTHISVGGGISSYVLDGKELYSCGYGGTGALGTGNTSNLTTFALIKTFNTNIKEIKHYSYTGGYTSSVILLEDGSVYTCGCNNEGQLGKGHTTQSNYYSRIKCDQKIKEVCLSYNALHLLNYDGEILVFGNNSKHKLGTGLTNTVVNMYSYSVFFGHKTIKSSYEKPDEDFIQIL